MERKPKAAFAAGVGQEEHTRDGAKKHGLKATVYYETVSPRGHPTVEGAVDDLTYMIEKYGKHPAWLKVRNKPVIFVYGRAVRQLKLDGWAKVMNDFRGEESQRRGVHRRPNLVRRGSHFRQDPHLQSDAAY